MARHALSALGSLAAALALALALTLALAFGRPDGAAAADTVAFTITDSRITESSGLAADSAAGLYWTVNDSGAGGVAYGIGPQGRVEGTLNYRATPVDIEAVAVHEDRLYLADIGDNNAVRERVTVYYFDQPRANGLIVAYRAYDFTYPDGPHDAETLLVNPAGRLFIVTKDANGGGVYAAPADPVRAGTNELKRVGTAPASVTDGSFLPGGRTIALLSYSAVTVVDASSYATVAEAAIPAQPQAESLAVSLDGDTLLVGSEGRRSKVYALPIPGAAATPTPSATPTSATPTGWRTDDGDLPLDEGDPTTGQSRAGTLLAVGLAGLVALVAGAVVVLVRKH